ncbi:Mitochondrial phosphate carrier protein 3 [Spatholobus suberectus]|nr:Mitochondrial phosphate carrier protein 3 [Spatholobus suberectus]
MAPSDSDTLGRYSLIPSYLYSSPSPQKKMEASSFMIHSPSENRNIKMFSPSFYAACTVGGSLSCGLTHTAITPLDVVKCNIQIDPAKYKNTRTGFGVMFREQGLRGFFRGWAPTLVGYHAQGAFKYGFYEFFKKYYSDIAGPEYATKYKTLIYLAGSASSEFIAAVALCPFEAVKVRVQTQPGFARGLADGLPKLVRTEGVSGLYKGIVPLWGRQVPYTMMKFASYENIVEMIYKHAIPKPKDECSKSLQLGVSYVGGYMAGILCAVVSHPADNLVSFLNNSKGATVGDAVTKLGLWGLFTRGLPLRILMVGTLTGAQWGIYDSFKVFVGLPTTGGVAPAAVPVPASAA